MTPSPSSSKSSSPESDYSRNYTVPIIHGNVSNGDDFNNIVQHFPVRDPVKKEDNTSNAKATVKSRKRTVTDAFSTYQLETDGVRAKQKAKIDTDSGEKTRIQLACPFQKLDSHKHHDCLKYALHRIKDVKQHIYRRHRQPDYYCARCFEIFKAADVRDEHARSNHCKNLPDPGFEGISEDQKIRLNKSSSRGLDPQEQWFEMWDIIFPGKPRPSSAWVGSYMEEMVPLLRSLWKNKRSNILAKVEKGQRRPLDRSLLDDVVGTIFNCLEDEASASLGKRGRANCSQNQQGPLGGQVPMSTPPSNFITESPHGFFSEPHGIFPDINTGSDAAYQHGFVIREE